MVRMIDQFGRKRCQKKRKDVVDYKLLKEFFQEKFCCAWAVGCRKFVQYIRMLWPGRFILVESVYVWSWSAQLVCRASAICCTLVFFCSWNTSREINKMIYLNKLEFINILSTVCNKTFPTSATKMIYISFFQRFVGFE